MMFSTNDNIKTSRAPSFDSSCKSSPNKKKTEHNFINQKTIKLSLTEKTLVARINQNVHLLERKFLIQKKTKNLAL